MPTPKFFQGLFIAAAAVAVAASPRAASASEVFPAAIQQAAGMPCVPSCLLCHTSNPGTILTFMNKPFGDAMFKNGAIPQNTDSLKAAYAKYALANPAVVDNLKNGIDPDNQGALCGGPTYGCGAHIAKEAPPGDASALLWALGAMVTAGVVRRRRSKGE